MSESISINLASPTDRARLRGWLDTAPRLSSRADITDPITDQWRDIIVGLLDLADQQQAKAESAS